MFSLYQQEEQKISKMKMKHNSKPLADGKDKTVQKTKDQFFKVKENVFLKLPKHTNLLKGLGFLAFNFNAYRY